MTPGTPTDETKGHLRPVEPAPTRRDSRDPRRPNRTKSNTTRSTFTTKTTGTAYSRIRVRAIRIWDLLTYQQIDEPLVGHTDSVIAVATAELPDGRAVAVTGSHDGTARMWNLDKVHEIGNPVHGHRGTVRGIATGLMDEAPIIASLGSDRSVRKHSALRG